MTAGLGMVANVGSSFTATTVIRKLFVAVSTPPLSMPPSSCAITVTVAVPLALAAGVKVSTPPVFTLGATLNRPGLLLLVATFVTLWPASSVGPVPKLAKPLAM